MVKQVKQEPRKTLLCKNARKSTQVCQLTHDPNVAFQPCLNVHSFFLIFIFIYLLHRVLVVACGI